jgi:hypothetical protein
MSMPAKVLGYGFALIAAAVSAAFAVTLSDDPRIKWLLAAISIGAVAYERCSLPWTQQNFRDNNNTAARLGYVLLIAACLYTASMQLGFFGKIMLEPVSADAGTASSITDADNKVIELEEKRSSLPKPPGDAESLSKLVKDLEAIKNKSTQDRIDLSNARNSLAAATALDKADEALAKARADRTALITKPPHDAKGAVFERFTLGFVPGSWFSYGAVILSVAMLQLMQICLPVVAGEGRKPSPPPLAAAAPPAAPLIVASAPAPLISAPPASPPLPPANDISPAPATAVKKTGRPRIAHPVPPRRGLAAKLRVVG